MMRIVLLVYVLLGSWSSYAEHSPFLERARALAGVHGVPLVKRARRVLTAVVRDGNLDPQVDGPKSKRHPAPFGLFITLVKNGEVRGCFGTMEPSRQSLETMVTEATLGAARFDTRSKPVTERELDKIQIILSIVGPTVPVVSIDEVDAKREGLLIRKGEKRSVLLPGEARTASWQLKRSLRQAGIRKGEAYEMFRFRTVTVYERGR